MTDRYLIDDDTIDRGDIFSIIAPVWDIVDTADEKSYCEGLKGFSIPQKYIFAICWYRAEINNGGHYQFYYNSAGIVWEDVIEGLKVIDLPQLIEILQVSTERMGEGLSKDRLVRINYLEENEPDFDDLDEMYDNCEMTQGIDSILAEYIKQNRKDFYYNS